MPPSKQPPKQPATIQPAELEDRLPLLLGLLLALLVTVNFIYPALAYPLQNLVTGLALLGGAVGLTGLLLARGGAGRAGLLAALGQWPLLGGLGLIAWAVARWQMMPVTGPGRDWVIGLLWLGVSMMLGAAAAVFSRVGLKTLEPVTVLRRALLLAALGFGLYAFYQYFYSYAATLREYQAHLTGPVADLQTQSMLFALRERRVAGTLGNPNVFAAQLALLAAFSLSVIAEDFTGRRLAGRIWRGLGGLGFVTAAGAIWLTRSRGGLLTLLLVTVLGVLAIARERHKQSKSGDSLPKKNNIAKLAILPLGGAFVLAAGQAWAASAQGWLTRLGNVSTIRERLFYWDIAYKIWARHPLIGEGPGGFVLNYLTLKSPLAHEAQYAHSWFFQTGAELGLIGLLLYGLFWAGAGVWLTGALLRRDSPPGNADLLIGDGKPENQENSPIGRSAFSGGGSSTLTQVARFESTWLLLALVALAFNGLFEFSLQWRPFLIMAGLLAGLAGGIRGMQNWTAEYDSDRDRDRDRDRDSGLKSILLSSLHAPHSALGRVGALLAFAICAGALILTPPYHLALQAEWEGREADEDSRPADAVEAYGRALRWRPDDASLCLARAGTLGRLGRTQEAWPLLERAARLNPHSAAVPAAQANWLARNGRPAEALAKLNIAVALYPSSVEHHLARAGLLINTGHPAEARADLETIEKNQLPVWEYQQTPYNQLRTAVGLPPVKFDAPPAE